MMFDWAKSSTARGRIAFHDYDKENDRITKVRQFKQVAGLNGQDLTLEVTHKTLTTTFFEIKQVSTLLQGDLSEEDRRRHTHDRIELIKKFGNMCRLASHLYSEFKNLEKIKLPEYEQQFQ